MLLLISKLIC